MGAAPFFSGAQQKRATINKLPNSVDELIDELDKFYPEYVPALGDAPEAIHRKAGARELVLHLKKLRAKRDRTDEPPRQRQRSR